jgi:hypothetical protein
MRVDWLHTFIPTFGLALLVALPGCAIAYRDSDTGTMHLWGIGHLKMRTEMNDGKKALIQGFATCGLSTGGWFDSTFLTLGWNRQQVVEIVDDNTVVTIAGPCTDLMTVSIGGEPPIAMSVGGEPCEAKTEDR